VDSGDRRRLSLAFLHLCGFFGTPRGLGLATAATSAAVFHSSGAPPLNASALSVVDQLTRRARASDRWQVPPPSTSAESHSRALLDSALGNIAERLEAIEGTIGHFQAELERTNLRDAEHALRLDDRSRGYDSEDDSDYSSGSGGRGRTR